MVPPRDERQRVERRDQEQEVPIPNEDRPVLEHAAEHGAEEVRAERHRRRSHVAEPLREDQVRGEHGRERQRDRGDEARDRLSDSNASGRTDQATTRRRGEQRRTGGAGPAAGSGAPPRSPRARRAGPAKTSAFTNHVVPNSSANCTTFFVSSSRNAAPMKNRSRYGRICDRTTRPDSVRSRSTPAARARARQVERGDRPATKVRERMVVGGRLGRVPLRHERGVADDRVRLQPDREHRLGTGDRADPPRSMHGAWPNTSVERAA